MQTRRDQLLRDESHDPTKPLLKMSDPTVCPDCGATYIDGRWTWRHGPAEAPRRLCSACQRIRNNYAAGFVTVSGSFARAHRDEIVQLVRNIEAREKKSHPIKRIMSLTETEDELVISTTEVHLAQAIGKALNGAFTGTLRFDFEEDIVRVDWRRDT